MSALRLYVPTVLGTLALFLIGCQDPLVVEYYGLDNVESVNGFDLFEEAVGQNVDLQRKGFLESSFFEQQDVILYLDRYGRDDAFQRLVPLLNELNNRWDDEEVKSRASLLIILKDTDANAEVWRKIALDMPEETPAREIAEKITAYEIARTYRQREVYPPILGMEQTRPRSEDRFPSELPVKFQGDIPILSEDNWPPMNQWYSKIEMPEQDRSWNYYPHWRSAVPDLETAKGRFGNLPMQLPVRRSMQPSKQPGFGPANIPESELDEETITELSDYRLYRTGHRTIISVAGRPLLVRIQYGQIPVYILAGSEPFLNWHMARTENVSFLAFMLHAVSENPVREGKLKVTYVERGLVNAGRRATEERSLIFLLAEEPWGLILLQFILVLIVFIWARFPHERTPLQPQESGTRNFKEHFEALGSRMVRSRNRIQGLAPLSRWKKKQSIDTVFPELKQNIKVDEETILNRMRKLWE